MSEILKPNFNPSFIHKVWIYLKDVVSNWHFAFSLIFGSALWAYSRDGINILPLWAVTLIPVILIVYASFFAWQQQFQEVLRLRGELYQLSEGAFKQKAEAIAEKYVQTFFAKNFPSDPNARMQILVQSGILEVKEFPSGLKETIRRIELKGAQNPLSDYWKEEGLFEFLEWVVRTDSTLLYDAYLEDYFGDAVEGKVPPQLPILSPKTPRNIIINITSDNEDMIDCQSEAEKNCLRA